MEKEENKKVKKTINWFQTIIISILLIVFLGIGYSIGLINATNKYTNEMKEDNTSDNTASKDSTLEETDLADSKISDEITKKVDNIWSYLIKSELIDKNKTISDNDIITSDDISEAAKKVIAFSASNATRDFNVDYIKAINNSNKITNPISEVCSNPSGNGCVGPEMIDKEEFDKNYKSYFNKKVSYDNSEELDTSVQCVLYYYISSIKKYYKESGCGYGTSAFPRLFYINKLTKKGNEIYAYTNAGLLTSEGENVSVLDDVYNGDILKIISFDESQNYSINETNNADFQEYKWTFTLNDNNNYYFERVEKLK